MIAELSDVLLCYCLPCCIVVILNLVIASKVRSANKSFLSPSPPLPLNDNPKKPLLQTSSSSFYTSKNIGTKETGHKGSTGSTSVASRKTSSRSVMVPATARITAGGGEKPIMI